MGLESKASDVRPEEGALLTALCILPAALMQFMGDQSKPRGKDSLALLHELLKVSQRRVCQDLEHPSRLPAWARMDSPTPCSLPPTPVSQFFQNTLSSAHGATFLATLLCKLQMLA